MKPNIYSTEVTTAVSILLVKIEQELRQNPFVSLKDFCDQLGFNPVGLLHSKGFNATILLAAIIPLKQILENNNDPKFDKIKTVRNALCESTYEFNNDGTITFFDNNTKLTSTPKEILDLARELTEDLQINQQVDKLLDEI